jgi:hypothetical protein
MLLLPTSCREQRIRAVEFSAPEAIAAIPDCNQDLFIGNKACSTFLFSPNDSSVVQVRGMLTVYQRISERGCRPAESSIMLSLSGSVV